MMKSLFYCLYNTGIIDLDAYLMWRDDVVDPTPDKDSALLAVSDLLSWFTEVTDEDHVDYVIEGSDEEDGD